MGFSMFSEDLTHPVVFFIHAVEMIPEPNFLGSVLKDEKPAGIPFASE